MLLTGLAIVLLGSGAVHQSQDDSASPQSLEAKKDYKGAAQAWEQVSVRNPSDPRAPLFAANDWYQAGQFDKAIPDFQRADDLGVSYKWDMPYSIACCWARQGDQEKAIDWLTKAMNLGVRDLNLVRTDEDLKSLHTDARFIKLAALADTTKMDRTEGLRYDLWLLDRELRRLHYSPYLRNSQKQIAQFVAEVSRDIPKLNDAQVAVRFKELAAMMGDGHTHVTTQFELPTAKSRLPVTFMSFQEGMFVITSDAAHADLLGCQVTSIGGHPISQVLDLAKPICSWDNSMWILAREPDFLRNPALLNGLGITPRSDEAAFSFRTSSGETKTATLKAECTTDSTGWKLVREKSANPTPLTLLHRNLNYWFDYLADSRTVYFQYNAVANMGEETIAKFAARLFDFIDKHEVDRLIVDMRWNGGGNNFLNKPLLEGLIKSKINEPGKLFVIAGRFTFSAAICGATQIERYTHAIFAGEPTGSSPNFIGESIPIKLPYSGMMGTVSDLYWQNSVAMDHRTWIAPAIYLPPVFAEYAENRDPVIDAILKYKAPSETKTAE